MLLKEQPSSKQGPSPKKQNKLPPATLPLECQLSRPKPPWVKGLIDKDSTYQKYQKRFGFLPTIWSAADPDKRALSKYAGCPSTSCQNSTSNEGGGGTDYSKPIAVSVTAGTDNVSVSVSTTATTSTTSKRPRRMQYFVNLRQRRRHTTITSYFTRSMMLTPPSVDDVKAAMKLDQNIVYVNLGDEVMNLQKEMMSNSLSTVKPLQPDRHKTKRRRLSYCSLECHHVWRKSYGKTYISPIKFAVGQRYQVNDGRVWYRRKVDSSAHLYLSILYEQAPHLFHSWIGKRRFVILKPEGDSQK